MVSFGYYQAVSLYDRADIQEGECILILIDPGAGKFAFDDLTENAVSTHTLLSPPSLVWYTLSCFSIGSSRYSTRRLIGAKVISCLKKGKHRWRVPV
jgi:hypothetical protein